MFAIYISWDVLGCGGGCRLKKCSRSSEFFSVWWRYCSSSAFSWSSWLCVVGFRLRAVRDCELCSNKPLHASARRSSCSLLDLASTIVVSREGGRKSVTSRVGQPVINTRPKNVRRPGRYDWLMQGPANLLSKTVATWTLVVLIECGHDLSDLGWPTNVNHRSISAVLLWSLIDTIQESWIGDRTERIDREVTPVIRSLKSRWRVDYRVEVNCMGTSVYTKSFKIYWFSMWTI